MIVWILRFSRYQEQLWDLCFSPLSCKVYVCVRVYMRVTCLALATAQWWDMEPFSFCSFTHIFCPSHAVCLSLCRMISCMGSQWCYVPQSPALTMTVLVKEHKATVWTQYFALSRSAFARYHLETPSQGHHFLHVLTNRLDGLGHSKPSSTPVFPAGDGKPYWQMVWITGNLNMFPFLGQSQCNYEITSFLKCVVHMPLQLSLFTNNRRPIIACRVTPRMPSGHP